MVNLVCDGPIDPLPPRTASLRACEVCRAMFLLRHNNVGRFCSRHCYGIAQRRRSAEFIADAQRYWRQGFSLDHIAELLGVTKGVISGLKTRNGFPPRPSPIGRVEGAAR